MNKKPIGVYLMFGGAVALAVGSFLPWLKVIVPLLGTITKSGTEGTDGWATVAAGAGFALLAYYTMNGKRHAPRWGLGLGAVTLAGLAYEFADITHRYHEMNSGDIQVATMYGSGLWVCGIGAVVGMIGSVMSVDALDRKAQERETTLLAERARDAVHASEIHVAEGMVCPNGHDNRPDAHFCDVCGSSILAAY